MKSFLIKFVLLVSIIFSISHDFVFYNIDPCMKDLSSVIKFENGQSNDPLCDIHYELHSPSVVNNQPLFKINKNHENILIFSKDTKHQLFKTEIFKPPSLNA